MQYKREKGKNILKCENGGTWNYRSWEKHGKSRIYFSNDHQAVGNGRISFFFENGKFNKKFPVLASEMNEIAANIDNLNFLPGSDWE